MSRTAESRPTIVLDLDAAQEVVNLVSDKPGDADEELLDSALLALQAADTEVDADDQRRAASGEVVAIEVTSTAASAIETLIEENREIHPRQLRSFGDRLRSKVDRARKRRRRRR